MMVNTKKQQTKMTEKRKRKAAEWALLREEKNSKAEEQLEEPST